MPREGEGGGGRGREKEGEEGGGGGRGSVEGYEGRWKGFFNTCMQFLNLGI